MKSHLKPIPLRRLSAALLLAGLSICCLLPERVDARTADIGHKEVPAIMLKNSSLKLVGTAVTRNPLKRIAVIEDLNSRRQWLFHEGDRAGGILIKSVRRDHIVIDAGKGEDTVKISGYLSQGRSTTVSLNVPPERDLPSPSATPINRVGSRERLYVIERAAAEAAFANPASVLDTVDIVPARFLNREVGFRIAAFDPASIFSKMGLRSGDLVLAINDQEIAGPQEATSFFEIIRQGGDIDLTVRRRARTYHINLLIE
ncbi:PDZ domain-containing protein [Desulfosarcina sp.]|uniref:PDZ domain-containing protein n=1 Tax=Desulfosarcina sp. TaxID=2027861 RepID=UPI003565E68B